MLLFWLLMNALSAIIWSSNAAIASDVSEKAARVCRMVSSSSLSVSAPAFFVVALASVLVMG